MQRKRRRAMEILVGCAALVMVVACSIHPEDGVKPSRDGESLVELTTRSVSECVADALARHGGDPRRVSALDCSLPDAPPCAGALSDDVSSIASLSNLRSLDLRGRCLGDAAPLAGLRNLSRLTLANNHIADIRPLGALRELEFLDLEGNPLIDTWRTESQEPFVHWLKLRELNLDSTDIEYLFPLWRLSSLRTLSVRNNLLWSLHQITRMTWLRRLYADGNSYLEDLSPLGDFAQLEELSIEAANIASIDPLLPLVAGVGGGRLRKVSLGSNFITSCAGLVGIEHDCSNQQSGWSPMRPWLTSLAMSTPVESVPSFAPAHFPVWTLDQVASGFELIKNAPIAWEQPAGGCDTRAYQSAALLRDASFPGTTTAHAFGNLRPLTPNFPTGYVSFDWHIALAVHAELPDGGAGYLVFDPALEPERPLSLQEWFESLVSSAGHPLDYSCARYRDHAGYGGNYCDPSVNPVAIDASGNLEVDAVNELYGLVCPLASCGTL
jgi:Leucine-rich repeat (LRR) protein